MNIYVGNIAFTMQQQELEQVFGTYGKVTSVKIIKDRETGRSKGFAFIEMENNEEGQAAINALNEHELGGRKLKVNEARPRTNTREQQGF